MVTLLIMKSGHRALITTSGARSVLTPFHNLYYVVVFQCLAEGNMVLGFYGNVGEALDCLHCGGKQTVVNCSCKLARLICG